MNNHLNNPTVNSLLCNNCNNINRQTRHYYSRKSNDYIIKRQKKEKGTSQTDLQIITIIKRVCQKPIY